jgi:hypothetical protein
MRRGTGSRGPRSVLSVRSKIMTERRDGDGSSTASEDVRGAEIGSGS